MAKKRVTKPAIVIHDNGTCKAAHIDIRDNFEELYELIGCHTVQMVQAGRLKIWLDEEGKIAGRPVNLVATKLWSYTSDVIVGTVVVM